MDQVPMGKVDKPRIDIGLMYEPIPVPRNKDACMIEMSIELGIRGEQLKQIKRCRKIQEAIFLSDITTENRRSIEANCITDLRESHKVTLRRH